MLRWWLQPSRMKVIDSFFKRNDRFVTGTKHISNHWCQNVKEDRSRSGRGIPAGTHANLLMMVLQCIDTILTTNYELLTGNKQLHELGYRYIQYTRLYIPEYNAREWEGERVWMYERYDLVRRAPSASITHSTKEAQFLRNHKIVQ